MRAGDGLGDSGQGWVNDSGAFKAVFQDADLQGLALVAAGQDGAVAEIEVLQEQQMNAVTTDAFKQILRGYKSISNRLDIRGFMSAIATRSRHLRNWLLFLERWPIVLTPVTVQPTPAPRADLEGDARIRELLRNDVRFVSAVNVLGLPAAVVPVGLHRGHPIGVQLIASRYREDLCLDAAQAIERRVGVLAHQLWERGDLLRARPHAQ